MNVKLYVIKDYENETTHRPKKTNPIQTQSKPVLSAVEWANFTYPQRHALSYAEGGKTEVRCRFSEVRYLSSAFCFLASAHGPNDRNRLRLQWHFRLQKKSKKQDFIFQI